MNTRAVLFDLDGVLIDSQGVWATMLRAAATHFGAPPVTEEKLQAIWGSGVAEDAELLFPDVPLEDVVAYYNAHFLDYVDQIKVNPDAAGVFEALTKAGRSYAVVTNTPHEAARTILDAVRLNPKLVVGGTDVPHAKPAPDMLLLALERLEVPPTQALMVGDTRYDREAAQAAGVRFAGYGIEGDVTLERLADLLGHIGI